MTSAAPPFGQWERSLALRYLRAKRKQGGVALISIISFIGITIAVAVLIIVMSVMNGFRSELISKIVGFNGHLYVAGPAINGPGRDALIARLRAVPGGVQVAPIVQSPVLVIGPNQSGGGFVRGMRPEDVAATPLVANNIKSGSLKGFGKGEYGGDLILTGATLAQTMGANVGDSLTLTSPGGATVFGTAPTQKAYTVGGVFSTGMSQYDSAFIFMPLDQAQLFLGRGSIIDQIEVNVVDPDHLDKVKPAVVQAAGGAAMVSDWRDTNGGYWTALKVEHNVMFLILLLIVLIAAANIISGLVMLVKNKGRDIAILRTMGASQGSVLRIFFLTGAWIGVAATITGL